MCGHRDLCKFLHLHSRQLFTLTSYIRLSQLQNRTIQQNMNIKNILKIQNKNPDLA